MALPWRRPRPVHPDPDVSAAEVISRLQELTSELRARSDRLERVTDTAQQAVGRGQP